jgi:signal transduction histidine kinase
MFVVCAPVNAQPAWANNAVPWLAAVVALAIGAVAGAVWMRRRTGTDASPPGVLTPDRLPDGVPEDRRRPVTAALDPGAETAPLVDLLLAHAIGPVLVASVQADRVQIDQASAALCQLLELRAADLAGMPLRLRLSGSSEACDQAEAALLAAMSDGRPMRCRLSLTDRYGTDVPLAARVEPLHGHQRAVLLLDSAQQRVRTDQSTSLAALSHDLRAPLRVVDGFARIVLEDYGDKLDQVGRDHLNRIASAAVRLNLMLDKVLELEQLERSQLAAESIDLSALVRACAEDMASQYGQASFHIEDGLRVRADKLLMRRAVENLIGNALKYSSRSKEPLVVFRSERQGDLMTYVVEDNGVGIDMRFADRLFGLFQRLHSANEFGGTGVGLTTVRSIIQRHGGRIWAESTPGQGARFYFTLWESGPQ